MATLVEQLYSQNHWVDLDGVQTVWDFTFAGPESGSYIYPAHVKAYYTDEFGERQNITVTEDMLIGPYQLQVIPPVPASATRFVIYRNTPKDMPLVDFEGGSQVTESNMDRAAKQAVFVAAEVEDGGTVFDVRLDDILARLAALEAAGSVSNPDTSEFGFKALKRNPYTGASVVDETDNGRSHYKTDGTDVSVPTGLPSEFLCTVANISDGPMTLTFEETATAQDGTGNAGLEWTVPAKCTATIWKAVFNEWLISGPVTFIEP